MASCFFSSHLIFSFFFIIFMYINNKTSSINKNLKHENTTIHSKKEETKTKTQKQTKKS